MGYSEGKIHFWDLKNGLAIFSGKSVEHELSCNVQNIEKKVFETKACVDKQMDEMQREREQTFKDIWTRLDQSAATKDLDTLRQSVTNEVKNLESKITTSVNKTITGEINTKLTSFEANLQSQLQTVDKKFDANIDKVEKITQHSVLFYQFFTFLF